MFPVYPLICFNAAVTLYLVRGWFEVVYLKATKSPYQVSEPLSIQRVTTSPNIFIEGFEIFSV